jgi:mannose-6-phosphate isomerase-like protein (cupin superfamily)
LRHRREKNLEERLSGRLLSRRVRTEEASMTREDSGLGDLEAVERRRRESGKRYLEFLRVASMSAGLYALPAGSEDPQSPHREDELYYVAQGRAKFRAGADERTVGPGSLLFVAAGVAHRFYEITEDLQILVFFAPPERE